MIIICMILPTLVSSDFVEYGVGKVLCLVACLRLDWLTSRLYERSFCENWLLGVLLNRRVNYNRWCS
jgi:hypothetical protein